ncbi:hypothetical protein RHOFW104T7_05900 [Rhodanobacter thiooxydans]|uniref:Uncharacterized protein n=1 Tax=Rhodanobacter thiooxydans TaxID=416169 RepID=A0A154QL57_9GAMM|nr:hypothetical protein [Rhodanobacter thiooxydans]EIL99646.1 hypothetical protein UUA_08191 [Rhodanobacter thiooxydans LCS2]KZC24955.1 hypothetical protein RHOFW104T7_05900 [Rhodanobacter thiooxydans]MCW0203617.1 hypothetical protein [Rhodanobacter thiooxydans]
MNAAARQHADAAHRARVLRALGVTPWQRRSAPAVAVGEAGQEYEPAEAAGVACVVVLPQGCSARELDLLGRALAICGAALARAARVTASDGQLATGVPEARAYLVFGEAQAHALGRALPAAAVRQAQIVLADEPALVLTSAGAKRRLWNALRSVRRALAAAGG